MIHISIEGLDGVGKTTIAKLLSQKLQLPFVEKPWSLYTDLKGGLKNYLNLTHAVNNSDSAFFRMCFYSLGTIVAQKHFEHSGLITDRFILSLFVHNRNPFEDEWLRLYFQQISLPTLTVILYASEQVRYQRIYQRNPYDPDLLQLSDTDEKYLQMRNLAKRYHLPYIWINTDQKKTETVVALILKELKRVEVLEE